MTTVQSLGPEVAGNTNGSEAAQSVPAGRMDLVPAAAVLRVAQVMARGADKYGDENWRSFSSQSHLNKALIHAYAHLAGDVQDDHLGHCACRVLMALDLELGGRAASVRGVPLPGGDAGAPGVPFGPPASASEPAGGTEYDKKCSLCGKHVNKWAILAGGSVCAECAVSLAKAGRLLEVPEP